MKPSRPPRLVVAALITAAAVVGLSPTASAQFARTFSSPEIVPPTLNATYLPVDRHLVVLLETREAREDAYLVVNATTGARVGAFRLDARHGAMPSPDGREIRIAGSEQTGDLQPVYFAGRYDAATLQPLAERQIAVDRDDGFNLSGEVSPDGEFVYRGSQATAQVNLVAVYDADFRPRWGSALRFRDRFEPLGLEAYPLPGGAVAFSLVVPEFAGAILTRHHAVGLLDATDGHLRWTALIDTAQSVQQQDDLRMVFGPDGSLLASVRTVDLLAPTIDTIRLLRLTSEGRLAYSKALVVPGASIEGLYHFGDATLVYLASKQDGVDRTQFVVLDGAGNLTANVALACQLRGGGQPKLTAARREGTDYIFLRLECGFATRSPEQTLVRLHPGTGAMDLRRLPSGVAQGPIDVVTTPAGDYLSPFNNSAGFVARSTLLAAILTHPLAGPGILALHELPSDSRFPTCVELTDSSATPTPALPVQLADTTIASLTEGATQSGFALPGMTDPRLRPDLRPLTFTETTLCSDDPVDPAPAFGLAASRTSDHRLEIRIPTTAGFRYRLQESADLVRWTDVAERPGDGSLWIETRSAGNGAAFLRAAADPGTR